jgi:ADP-heptose:LPS heptosyltransferase
VFSYLKLIYYLLRPRTVFLRRTSDGLGDNVLLSALLPVIRERLPDHKIVVETPWKEVFDHNPFADWVTDKHIKTTRRHIKPVYRVDKPGDRPFLEQMLSYVGPAEDAVPCIYLTDEEVRQAARDFPGRYIAVCPVSKTAFSSNRREWGLGRFQDLREKLSGHRFVQVGLKQDPLLNNTVDARGLSVRRSAAVVHNAWFFLGLEGGFMHVARAVGTRSVIIFGGYILPEISGYRENLNISSKVDCSPCYDSHASQIPCETMLCMKAIDPRMVYDRIKEEFIGPNEREQT